MTMTAAATLMLMPFRSADYDDVKAFATRLYANLPHPERKGEPV